MRSANNPYVTSHPVGGTPAFVGRDALVRALLQEIADPARHATVLYGARKMGRTSLLQHLLRVLREEPGLRPVYVDMTSIESSGDGSEIVQLARMISDQLGSRLVEVPVLSVRTWVREIWLPDLRATLSSHESLVLMLDEFSDRERTVLDDLLAVSASLRVHIILSLSNATYPGLRDRLEAVRQLRVAALNRSETDVLARLSEMNGTLLWTTEAVSRAWDLTSGHPWMLQALCSAVWKRSFERGDGAVTWDDVQAAVPPTLDQSAALMELYWANMTYDARMAAQMLARVGPGTIALDKVLEINDTTRSGMILERLRAALLSLEDADIIAMTDGGYLFHGELLRRWISKRAPDLLDGPSHAREERRLEPSPARSKLVVARERPRAPSSSIRNLAARLHAALRRLDTAPRGLLVALTLPAGALAGFALLANPLTLRLASFALLLLAASLFALTARPVTVPADKPSREAKPSATP